MNSNPLRVNDPSGHSPCDVAGADPECYSNAPTYIGLFESEIQILITLMAFESTSGYVPDSVTYLKAWALLNLRTYNIEAGFDRTPLGHWRGHESELLNGIGITGSDSRQVELIINKYREYKYDKNAKISGDRFIGIEAATRKAVYDWYTNGRNSSADPVRGATGFTDASGLRYPNGAANEPYLKDVSNYMQLMTDQAAIEHQRTKYAQTGVVSELYIFSIWPWTSEEMWTFSWFAY